jgi:ABC-2 type transport system permease protein
MANAFARERRRPFKSVADGTDANSTNVALGYAGALIADYARELAAASGVVQGPPLVSAEVRVWFNPQLESRDFMIPGIPGLASVGRHDEPLVDGHRS